MSHPVRSGRPHFPHIRLIFALLACGVPSLAAQELPLKQGYPGSSPFTCPASDAAAAPGEEERAEAARLGSGAAQAVILGDLERAGELLARATEIDPSSADLAYDYARILEDQGETDDARVQLCRVLALGSDSEDVGDARARLEELAARERAAIPEEALEAYRVGLSRAQSGLTQTAEPPLREATEAAPDWAAARYNLGVVLARLGRRGEAVAELRRYLDLSPDADDALAVSQRIGQLESVGTRASPGTALALGLLVPGMGQLYSGRALPGISVLALAGGAAATGYLIEEVKVECLADVPPGGTCPPGQAFDESTDRPYLTPGLGVAALVMVVGAVEAFVKARNAGGPAAANTAARPVPDGPRLGLPTVTTRGSRVALNLLRIRF